MGNIKWSMWTSLAKEKKIDIQLAAANDMAQKAGVSNERVSLGAFTEGPNGGITMEFVVQPNKTTSLAETVSTIKSTLEDTGSWEKLTAELPVDLVDGSVQTS